MVDTLVAVLALIVACVALTVAWSQLVLQRDAAGGRGVIFDVRRPSRYVDQSTTPHTVTDHYRVLLKIVGNDRHEVTLHLERDGVALEEDDADYVEQLPTKHRMTCEDDPLIWKFSLDQDVAKSLRCIALWVEPFGDAIRSRGFRRKLTGRNIEDAEFEEWHWYRFFRFRRRFESWAAQRGPKWFREKAGRPATRRVAAVSAAGATAGPGPAHLGCIASRGQWRRRSPWWCL